MQIKKTTVATAADEVAGDADKSEAEAGAARVGAAFSQMLAQALDELKQQRTSTDSVKKKESLKQLGK